MQFTLFDKTVLSSRPMRLLLTTAVFVSTVTGAVSSKAQNCEELAGYKCEYEMVEQDLQKVPPFFKFQTRISQAKLPVGDVIFDKIFVNVKAGEAALCKETFSQVPVRDSVLNLEIGRTMDCELGTIISKNQNLKFQICIGNEENCLKPVSLSSVPYSIKSSYSYMASKAHTANEAVQCHYAHRMTADKSLFENKKIGIGFYDFHTPDIGAIDRLIDMYDSSAMSTPNPYYSGGFIQWAQIDPVSSNLHICAQYPESTGNELGRLEELVFHAAKTQSFGQLVALGDPMYTREGDNRTKTPSPDRGLIAPRGMTASGVAYFDDDVLLRNEVGMNPNSPQSGIRRFEYDATHTLEGYGVSNFHNDVNVGNTIVGEEDYGEYTNAEGKTLTVNTWMNVNNISEFRANARFYENVAVSGDTLSTSSNTTLDVDGPSIFDNSMTVNGAATYNNIVNVNGTQLNVSTNTDSTFYGPTTFYGDVNIEGDLLNAIPEGSIGNFELTDDEILEVLGLTANTSLGGVVIQGVTTSSGGTGGRFEGGQYGLQAEGATAGEFSGNYYGITASAASSAGVGGYFTGFTGLHAVATTSSSTSGWFEGGFYGIEADGGYGGGQFSGDSRGIYANATSATGVGVYGTGGRVGVEGGNSEIGVRGNGSGIGVEGISQSGVGGRFRAGTVDVFRAPINIGVHTYISDNTSENEIRNEHDVYGYYGHELGDIWIETWTYIGNEVAGITVYKESRLCIMGYGANDADDTPRKLCFKPYSDSSISYL